MERLAFWLVRRYLLPRGYRLIDPDTARRSDVVVTPMLGSEYVGAPQIANLLDGAAHIYAAGHLVVDAVEVEFVDGRRRRVQTGVLNLCSGDSINLHFSCLWSLR